MTHGVNNIQFFDLTKENQPDPGLVLADSLDSLRHAIEDNTMAVLGAAARVPSCR